MSFSLCSPRSLRAMPGRSSSSWLAVVCERSTCPPCPTAQILAARCTDSPTYRSTLRSASPVWMPIRTCRAAPPGHECSATARWHAARSENGSLGTVEGDEEGVALVVDLLTAVRCECFAEQPAVLGQDVCVLAAVGLEQLRRAFDIREQE